MTKTNRPMVRIYTSVDKYIDRQMNDEEFAQYEIDKEASLQRLAEMQAKAEAKAAAQSKLATLGLTVEDLKALGL